ncbi:MAG: MBL fold metallo-hydrolase, partial [Gammaproteobacteria bacterium]|nr:MBL fold metallo-hydrolase [Gammaproteobacteria bacterium]
MIITFYGVRGSTAAPGPQTAKYGGNTSCVHIELDTGHDLILDAGTGIR